MSRRGRPRQVAGTRILRLGDADLELVDWRHEAPDDDPHVGGRLVFEPVEIEAADVAGAPDAASDRPADEAADRAAVGEAIRANPALRLAGVCWATVELDRAEAELGPWLGPATASRDGTEPHLGARTRARASRGLPGPVLVLAEPVTEGRLAASLARDGEGPCALYLDPVEGLDAWLAGAALRGVAVSAIRRWTARAIRPHRGPAVRAPPGRRRTSVVLAGTPPPIP